MLYALNVVAGILLGGLFGLAMGLSASPTVKAVLGGLVGAVAVFLALTEKTHRAASEQPSSSKRETKQQLRIIAFALGAIGCIFIGLTIRANNLLATSSLRQEFDELKSIGLSDEAARGVILTRFQHEKSTNSDSAGRGVSALFASSSNEATCRELDPTRFATASDVLTKYANSGEPWSRVAEMVRQYEKDPSNQLVIIKFFYATYCEKNK